MKNVLLFLLRIYSAFAAAMTPRCRFWPTCSRYAYEAIETYGAGRGVRLTARRLMRCHPFGGHGFDPVPLSGES